MAAPIRISRCMELCLKFFRFHSVQARYFTSASSGDGDNKQDDFQPMNKDSPTEQNEDASEPGSSSLSFAEAFAKHAAIEVDKIQQEKESPKQEDDFATMLRNSTHIHIGAAKGQIVVGRIFHVVADDLYIDFGAKFHCVCKRPQENAEKYHRGAQVRLRLKDLEVADHFIGATKEFSILEADADLLGLMDSIQPAASRY